MCIQRIVHRAALILVPAFLLAGCRTAGPIPAVNLTEPGWRIQRGQAIWRREASAPDVAGELLVATHPDGRACIEFTKTPLPFLIAQVDPRGWSIRWVLEDRQYSGRGKPPKRLLWLHLPGQLRGDPADAGMRFRSIPPDRWELENLRTAERLEGYLQPVLDRVRPGETLEGLARRWGVEPAALRGANPDAVWNSPPPGALILVPAGSP